MPLLGVASAVALVCSVYVAGARAQPPPPPPKQALALVGAGAVWFDEGPLVLQRGRSGRRSLGAVLRPARLPQMASSPSAAAGLLSDERFVGGVPPGPMRRIAQPRPVSGGGCRRWVPATDTPGDFVVAGDDLVAAAVCEPIPKGVEFGARIRQPLFLRDLRGGGGWRVLRWLPGELPPILAAEGMLVASGVQVSAARMMVTILDVRDGASKARFPMPDGYLAFASPNRLLLSVAVGNGAPLEPQLRFGSGTYGGPGNAGGYSLALYSTQGRRTAGLGFYREIPLVSHTHMLGEEFVGNGPILTVRGLPTGRPRPVIGFNDPARKLVALAFRWPTLVLDETTSLALPAGLISCARGYYGQPSKPFLQTLDLARPTPFLAPPPSSPNELQNLLRGCPVEA
jgi:hypothetical protein